ncbi:hypothetical protein GNI_133070 [Gregarina niphandrodes]|uniref:Uncharacterized protein n=1 Tax=Gregarina niphandrodes TaxID=110365 RepID=A0A023B1B2_GRENI|nr:hypothetical protein GNI_133070 [Gregarina niphandrodes]EZG46739.1 hypothetical protein GNI_133070 [Gregarina niphandrodes]|eukprot:XP_011132248.1 hypothetical protein GNI_133070 [Gregarina niphandrodes]
MEKESKGTQVDDEFNLEEWLAEFRQHLELRDLTQKEAWASTIEQQQAVVLENLRFHELLAEYRLSDRPRPRKFQSWTRIVDGGSEEPVSNAGGAPVGGAIPRILSTMTLAGVSCDGATFDGSPNDSVFDPPLDGGGGLTLRREEGRDDEGALPVTREAYRLQLPSYKKKRSLYKSSSSSSPSSTKWCIAPCWTYDDHLLVARTGEALLYKVSFSFGYGEDFAHVCELITTKYPFNYGIYVCKQDMRAVCGIRKKNGTGISVIDLVAECEISFYGSYEATDADVVCCGKCDRGYFSFHRDSTIAIWDDNRLTALVHKQITGFRSNRQVRSAVFLSDEQLILVIYEGIPTCVVGWSLQEKRCRYATYFKLRHEIRTVSVARRMSTEPPVTLCLTTSRGNHVVLMPVLAFLRNLDIRDMEALRSDEGAEAAQLLYNVNGVGICATVNQETGISIWTLEGGELLSRIQLSALQPVAETNAGTGRRRSQSLQSLIGSSIKTTGASIIPILQVDRKSQQETARRKASSTSTAAGQEALESTQNDLQWIDVDGRWFLAATCGSDIVSILDPLDASPPIIL